MMKVVKRELIVSVVVFLLSWVVSAYPISYSLPPLGTVIVRPGKVEKREANDEDTIKTSLPYNETSGEYGWWWYREERERKLKKLPKDVSRPSSPHGKKEKTKQEVLPLEKYTYEELLYMEPEKFRKIFNYYLNQALKEPNEKNMYYFFNILDVARKKAALFSYVYAYTARKYAQYLPTVAYPVAYPGIMQRIMMTKEEIENYVFGKKDMYGLILFMKEECPYCDLQLKILEKAELSGLRIKRVYYEDYPEIVTRFGIETFPSLIIVYRDGRYMPIGSGVMSLSEIYRAISKA
ncbi:hypothetical protein DRO29_05915, partial [Candidatus Bathyarchaeota archaeon]